LDSSWPDIAAAAGVAVEDVLARFPTLEDLVPGCGELALAEMRLPPPEAAPGLFAGQDAGERLDTLVAILFAVYDRAAPSIETLRRDADRIAVVSHARAAFEEARDGLIAAALGPGRSSGATLALA